MCVIVFTMYAAHTCVCHCDTNGHKQNAASTVMLFCYEDFHGQIYNLAWRLFYYATASFKLQYYLKTLIMVAGIKIRSILYVCLHTLPNDVRHLEVTVNIAICKLIYANNWTLPNIFFLERSVMLFITHSDISWLLVKIYKHKNIEYYLFTYTFV